ncbi:MAG: type VII toxin-antitoxin system MntA family adenylyltransferase antitoxin [Planctomycetota bacterium]|jgi:predicted nucleotidyltransferase
MDRDAVAERVRQVVATHPGVVAVYLFGSVARGTAKPSSDVDVAVLYEQTPPSELGAPPMKLEAALEKELHRRVQVVCLNKAPPDLGIRVLRHGTLLVERDRSARIRFEVKLRNEYWDLEPILRRCRKREGAAP